MLNLQLAMNDVHVLKLNGGKEYLLLLQIILKRKTNNTDKELIIKFEQECTDEFSLKELVLNYFIIWMKHFGYLLIL